MEKVNKMTSDAFDASIDVLTEELIAAVAKLPSKARTNNLLIWQSVALNIEGYQTKRVTQAFNDSNSYKFTPCTDKSVRREFSDRWPRREIQSA